MSVETLLAEIRAAGGHVEARGDWLDIEAPQPLPEALIEELHEHKAALLSLLRPRSGRCPKCDVRIEAGAADSMCRDCPAWEPTFARIVPYEMFERVRQQRQCAACRRLGAACHRHYNGPEDG